MEVCEELLTQESSWVAQVLVASQLHIDISDDSKLCYFEFKPFKCDSMSKLSVYLHSSYVNTSSSCIYKLLETPIYQ